MRQLTHLRHPGDVKMLKRFYSAQSYNIRPTVHYNSDNEKRTECTVILDEQCKSLK